MTVYLGSKMAAGIVPRSLPLGVEVTEISTYNIAGGAAFALNDTVQMLKIASNPSVPGNGPSICSTVVDVPALDSSTGIIWALGDSTTADRYITAATIGRSAAGGIQGMNKSGALGYQPFSASFNSYTTVSYSEYVMTFKVTTAATGTAATTGIITLKATYTIDP